MVAKYKNTCSRLSLLTGGEVSTFRQIVLAALAVLVQYPAEVSSFFFFLESEQTPHGLSLPSLNSV